MPRKTKTHLLTPIDVALSASSWDSEQLEEMAAIIDGLRSVVTLHTQQQDSRGEGGYVEQKIINGCGPYRYLRYWHQGKRKSVYLGKAVVDS